MTEIKNEANPLYERILNSPGLLGLLCFFIVLAVNFAYLANPPYWDDILSLHNQALWLAKHNFNIFELWQPGQGFWEGGSNDHQFGILPFLYGMFYYVFPAKTVHVLGHLFNIGCLALAFGLSYSILRKFKLGPYQALLWCIAALCEPVMAGRAAALGQESPLLCATILSIYFMLDKKYCRGIFFIFLAMLVKMTGGVLAAAFVLWLALDICLAKGARKERLKKYLPYLISGIILIVFFLFASFGRVNELEGDKILPGRCFINMRYQFPVLLPVQFAALLMLVFAALWRLFVILKNKSLFNLSRKDRISLLLLILTGGFWGAYAVYHCSLPRYSSFIVLPMYLFIALNTFTKNKWLTISLASVLLAAGVINIRGRYYSPLISRYLRSGEYLERSREYLDDLRENQAACRLLETKYFNRPVVAKWPFLQMLTIPEMGYVTKALPNVYAACPPIKYAKVKVYKADMKMPDNTLYVFAFNSLEAWTEFGPSLFPKRDKRYRIILKNQIRGGWFIIYEKEPAR